MTMHIVPENRFAQFIQEEPRRVSGFPGDVYYLNEAGLLHREDGPAIIGVSGRKDWCYEGLLHRDGAPAVEYGRFEEWWNHGKKHRVGGPAKVTYTQRGFREEWWYQNNKLHREDGPAIDFWTLKSTLEHIHAQEWWLFGNYISLREEIRDEWKWLLLNGNIENIKVIKRPTKRMQAYVLHRRPDLAGSLNQVHPEIAKEFQHAMELSGVDL